MAEKVSRLEPYSYDEGERQSVVSSREQIKCSASIARQYVLQTLNLIRIESEHEIADATVKLRNTDGQSKHMAPTDAGRKRKHTEDLVRFCALMSYLPTG